MQKLRTDLLSLIALSLPRQAGARRTQADRDRRPGASGLLAAASARALVLLALALLSVGAAAWPSGQSLAGAGELEPQARSTLTLHRMRQPVAVPSEVYGYTVFVTGAPGTRVRLFAQRADGTLVFAKTVVIDHKGWVGYHNHRAHGHKWHEHLVTYEQGVVWAISDRPVGVRLTLWG